MLFVRGCGRLGERRVGLGWKGRQGEHERFAGVVVRHQGRRVFAGPDSLPRAAAVMDRIHVLAGVGKDALDHLEAGSNMSVKRP